MTETNYILTDNQVTTDQEGISRTEGGRKVYISYKAEREERELNFMEHPIKGAASILVILMEIGVRVLSKYII